MSKICLYQHRIFDALTFVFRICLFVLRLIGIFVFSYPCFVTYAMCCICMCGGRIVCARALNGGGGWHIAQSGRTALMLAASIVHVVDCVRLLLVAGADKDAKDTVRARAVLRVGLCCVRRQRFCKRK